MKATFTFKTLLILIFITSPGSEILFSQTNLSGTALEISKGEKIKYIKPGRKIRVWSEGQKYKVWIDSISPNKIHTSQGVFDINKTDKIAVNLRATQISGGIVGTAGIFTSSLSVYLIIKGFQADDLGGIFMVIIGILGNIIAIPVTAIGTTVFFIGKKYKTDKGWRFNTVQIE